MLMLLDDDHAYLPDAIGAFASLGVVFVEGALVLDGLNGVSF